MPDKKGFELISGILGNAFHLPIIILTGYSDLVLAKSSLKIGISDYLVKDELTPAILYKTIVFAINRSGYINQIDDEKNNYENLFNFNPQPTWLLEAESLIIINANIAAQKKYGYSLADFQKMSFTQLHPNVEEQLIKQKLTLKADEISKNHFTHILSSGKKIKVDIYFRKIKSNSKGKLIIQSNDISETLKYIDTIEIQNAKLREIAWAQSHLVRAPLARILGLINLIEMKPDNHNELLYCLKLLRTSGNELDDIIKNIVNETNETNLID